MPCPKRPRVPCAKPCRPERSRQGGVAAPPHQKPRKQTLPGRFLFSPCYGLIKRKNRSCAFAGIVTELVPPRVTTFAAKSCQLFGLT